MIEFVDMGIIATLFGKIGWDERTRRKNGRNGNGPVMARLATLEASVKGLTKTVDSGFNEIRDEIKEARQARGDLHSRITENAKLISRVEGRLDKQQESR